MPTSPAALAVCSWSLRPESPQELAALVGECGLRAVQLALDPIRRAEWSLQDTQRALRDGDISIVSGMMAMQGEDYSSLESIRRTGGVRPDHTAARNLDAARANADIAASLGLSLVTLHAGCVPEDRADPLRGRMVDRLREVCVAFVDRGVAVAFETGQDAPQAVLGVLENLGDLDVGVNFDPANMILYGTSDPTEALRALAPRVRQAHIKDAAWATTRGEWGTEVVAGEGDVDWPSFFATIREQAPSANLVIEREAGGSRIADVRRAAILVQSLGAPRCG